MSLAVSRTRSDIRHFQLSRSLAEGLDLLDLHQANPERYPYLLESLASTSRERFDILFAFPRCGPGDVLRLDVLSDSAVPEPGDFLSRLDAAWLAESRAAPSDATELEAMELEAREREARGWEPIDSASALPFSGGWFVFLGYELLGQIEPSVSMPGVRSDQLPIAFAQRVPAALIRDRQSAEIHLVAETASGELIEQMLEDVENLPGRLPSANSEPFGDGAEWGQLSEDDPGAYRRAFERVQSYIRDGDVFQVNLSRGWFGEMADAIDPAAIYRRLRATNPAPFGGLARLSDQQAVISSSPERLVCVRNGVIETRPIAGTHPRAADAQEDAQLKARLVAHPKERAEHVMLIDLERNDLGRVCRPGSVEVDELMAVESYTHVHHIVSNVRGELRAGVSPGEVIRAVFPGGTITGCPKVRCMQIIAELEGRTRGAYTGAMGYLNRNGDLDLNILIRSITVDGPRIGLRSGAGLVADSDVEREIQETRNKALGMLRALGLKAWPSDG